MQKAYAALVIDRPWLTLGLLLALALVAGVGARDFRLDASSDSLVVETDPDLALWRESFVTESVHAGRRMLSFDIPKHLRKGGGGRGVPARGYLWDERLLELWDTAIKPNLTKGGMVPGAKHQESAAANAAKRRWSREWEMAEEEAGVEKITGRSIYALKHRFVTRCIASDQLAYAAMSCGVDEGTLRKYYNVDRANPDFEAMFQVLDGTPPDASEGDAEAA